MSTLWDTCVSTLQGQSTFFTCTLIPHPDVTGHKPSSGFLWMGKPGRKGNNGHVFSDEGMRPSQTSAVQHKFSPKQQSIYGLSVANGKGQNMLQAPETDLEVKICASFRALLTAKEDTGVYCKCI